MNLKFASAISCYIHLEVVQASDVVGRPLGIDDSAAVGRLQKGNNVLDLRKSAY